MHWDTGSVPPSKWEELQRDAINKQDIVKRRIKKTKLTVTASTVSDSSLHKAKVQAQSSDPTGIQQQEEKAAERTRHCKQSSTPSQVVAPMQCSSSSCSTLAPQRCAGAPAASAARRVATRGRPAPRAPLVQASSHGPSREGSLSRRAGLIAVLGAALLVGFCVAAADIVRASLSAGWARTPCTPSAAPRCTSKGGLACLRTSHACTNACLRCRALP